MFTKINDGWISIDWLDNEEDYDKLKTLIETLPDNQFFLQNKDTSPSKLIRIANDARTLEFIGHPNVEISSNILKYVDKDNYNKIDKKFIRDNFVDLVGNLRDYKKCFDILNIIDEEIGVSDVRLESNGISCILDDVRLTFTPKYGRAVGDKDIKINNNVILKQEDGGSIYELMTKIYSDSSMDYYVPNKVYGWMCYDKESTPINNLSPRELENICIRLMWKYLNGKEVPNNSEVTCLHHHMLYLVNALPQFCDAPLAVVDHRTENGIYIDNDSGNNYVIIPILKVIN